jgi:flagellar biogenesis protein FliO
MRSKSAATERAKLRSSASGALAANLLQHVCNVILVLLLQLSFVIVVKLLQTRCHGGLEGGDVIGVLGRCEVGGVRCGV